MNFYNPATGKRSLTSWNHRFNVKYTVKIESFLLLNNLCCIFVLQILFGLFDFNFRLSPIMPNLKAKSEENIHAANLLIDKSLFTASVHCSYYAAFQMSKYVLANFCDVGYKEQDNNSKGQGSHQYVSTVMSNNLEKKNRFYMIDYNRHYKTIKYLRNKAYYSTDFIDKEEAKEALESSNGIIRLLISKYCEL